MLGTRRKRKAKEVSAFLATLSNFTTAALQKVLEDTGDQTGMANLPIVGFDYNNVSENFRKVMGVDILIEIYPAGWPPESYIACRFVKVGGFWRPKAGTISATHQRDRETGHPYERHFVQMRDMPPYYLANR